MNQRELFFLICSISKERINREATIIDNELKC